MARSSKSATDVLKCTVLRQALYWWESGCILVRGVAGVITRRMCTDEPAGILRCPLHVWAVSQAMRGVMKY